MRVKAINLELHRAKGRPLWLRLTPETVGGELFALLAGLAEGFAAFDSLRERYELKRALAAKRLEEAVQN